MSLEKCEASAECASRGLAPGGVHADRVLTAREAWILAPLSNAVAEPPLEGTVDERAVMSQPRRYEVSALDGQIGIGQADGESHAAEIESVAETARVLGCTDDARIGLESWGVR